MHLSETKKKTPKNCTDSGDRSDSVFLVNKQNW